MFVVHLPTLLVNRETFTERPLCGHLEGHRLSMRCAWNQAPPRLRTKTAGQMTELEERCEEEGD